MNYVKIFTDNLFTESKLCVDFTSPELRSATQFAHQQLEVSLQFLPLSQLLVWDMNS